MKPTACDIVILPTGQVRDLAIKLSKLISPQFFLNDTDLLPHITLAMGFTDDFSLLKTKIAEIVSQFEPFEIVVNKAQGKKLYIVKSNSLRQLQKHLIWRANLNFDPFEKDIDHAFFNRSGEKTSRETSNYTRNFIRDRSDENWVPHITLGWDDNDGVDIESVDFKANFPMKFTVNDINLCHLGNRNTCRKVLGTWKLK